MAYGIISADCHMDLMFVPHDTFTARAPAGWRDRMPRIVESDDGFTWVAGERGELRLGPWASQGSRVWSGVRGRHMREAGYAPEDRRPATPELRLADLERDRVDAEVIYGIFQLQNHVSDGDLVAACFTAYNQFIAEFCATHPTRFFGLGCIPGHTVEAGVLELERCARLGLPGAEWSYVDTSRPVWHPQWEPLWAAAADHNIPLSFHVRTKGTTTTVRFEPEVNLVSTAAYNAVVQMQLDEALASVLMSGALERHPNLRVVLAESGVGWIPYVLERADYEWEDHIDEYGRALKTPPSELFRRQMYATFQKDSVGPSLAAAWCPDSFMWGSDYPHEDGVWPDSHEAIGRYLSVVTDDMRRKLVRDNCARLYGIDGG